MGYRNDAASDAFLGELSRQVLVRAAERLQVDPLVLAQSLANGRLADLVLELRTAVYWAYPRDRDRIEELLEGLDRGPDRGPALLPPRDRGTVAGRGAAAPAALPPAG